MTLQEAAHALNDHLRSKFTNPMKPWFAVATRTDSILILFDKNRPCGYTEWEGYPVEYTGGGMPIIGTGDDE